MTADKLDYVYNYIMDDIESSEANAVEHAINNIMKRGYKICQNIMSD